MAIPAATSARARRNSCGTDCRRGGAPAEDDAGDDVAAACSADARRGSRGLVVFAWRLPSQPLLPVLEVVQVDSEKSYSFSVPS
jgi:hypothetical protein